MNKKSEILQVQSPSELNSDQAYKTIGTDVSCNLGSTNITHLMESSDFGSSVRTAFRALTYVADSSNIEEVPTVKNANDKYHSVGLGAMGLHGFLAKNGILYGSPESIEFTGMYFQLLNYWTLFESNRIAIERNQAFYNFDKSEYANGKYFKRYLPRVKFKNNLSDTVKELFKDVDIPTAQDWVDLQASIEEHGLYNSYRLAVAP